MTTIKHCVIIYNPNSTGDGKQNAELLASQLKDQTDVNVELLPTKHAGHAEEIVKSVDKAATTLVVSSSGDGGYHELVNGIMTRPTNTPARLITGLLPSGNANDHYNAVHRGDLLRRIKTGDIDQFDVLKIASGNWTRYAHSYIGIGLSPHIGKKLTEATLNPLLEAWLVVRHFFTASPVKIRVNGKVRRYDSLIFSTISRMSKYMTLSSKAVPDDGKFEITSKRSDSIINLIKYIFKASTTGLTDEANQVSTFSFTPIHKTMIQLDGEVFQIEARAKVTVTIEKKALHSII